MQVMTALQKVCTLMCRLYDCEDTWLAAVKLHAAQTKQQLGPSKYQRHDMRPSTLLNCSTQQATGSALLFRKLDIRAAHLMGPCGLQPACIYEKCTSVLEGTIVKPGMLPQLW